MFYLLKTSSMFIRLHKLFYRKLVFQSLVGLLIIATLQFFVPLLNAAVSDRCCESQLMQCCQAEFPSRTVCCNAKAKDKLDDSAPTQGLTPKAQNTFAAFCHCPPTNARNLNIPSLEELRSFPAPPITLADNQLYRRFSTLLI